METLEEITQQEAEEILEAFQLFDKNGDGHISVSELPSLVRHLNQNPSDADLASIMAAADSDGSGTLDYEEFKGLIGRITISPEVYKCELRQAFLVLDVEKKGWLHKHQLQNWLTCVGEPMSPEDTQAILDEADQNGDGTIDCDEFVEFLCKKM